MYSDKTARLEIYYQALPTFVQTHSQMVGQYAEILANYAQLRMSAKRTSGELPEQVNWMGRYHDIGKAAIAREIWEKSCSLNQMETQLTRMHTILGAYLVRGKVILPNQEREDMDMWETIAQCCQYHHERWDGTGYPFGLKEEEIPWCARVIAIADTFDAMTAERPYREKMPYEAAVREIRCQAGKQFDPTLAHLFCEAIQCHFRAVI